MGGQHLTWNDRIAIESLLKAKVSVPQIAAVVGCSKRTIYREIQRGLCEQLNGQTYEMYTIYSAQKAQNRADQMHDLHKGRPVKLCPELAAHLEDYIGTRHYSPAAAVREILLQGLALPTSPPARLTATYTAGISGYAALIFRSGIIARRKKSRSSTPPRATGMTAVLMTARKRLKPAQMLASGKWIP